MLIGRALDRFQGNRRLAARALNISTVTLWRKIRDLDLEVEAGGAPPAAPRRRRPRKEPT
ncbi:Bacterial regulatory protein, Fis family [compost metagenome]